MKAAQQLSACSPMATIESRPVHAEKYKCFKVLQQKVHPHLEIACPPVILNQVVLVQNVCRAVRQVHPPLKQIPVSVQSIQRHTVQLWVTHHAHVQVAVPQPCSSIPDILHGAQNNLSVEIVWDGLHKLGLNGQLHVEEGKVELQLLMTCMQRQQPDVQLICKGPVCAAA